MSEELVSPVHLALAIIIEGRRVAKNFGIEDPNVKEIYEAI